MPIVIEPQTVPLQVTSEGAIRVVGTRIGLDVIVSHFNNGESPETIAAKFPTLSLSDAYAVIAFYLRNRREVDTVLAEQDATADALQSKIESQPHYRELRERLLNRKPAVPQP
jgi:uncharacterized protein (DUF433 family)